MPRRGRSSSETEAKTSRNPINMMIRVKRVHETKKRRAAPFSLLCVFLLVMTSCSTPHRIPVAVAIPNLYGLGGRIDENELIITGAGASNGFIYPVEVRLVVERNAITEVQALYAREVDINTIAAAIAFDRNNHEVLDLHSLGFRMWGNQKEHCQIQLREYGGEQVVQEYGPVLHEGEKLLIVTQTHSKRKGVAH